jgi:hypothetical protein
VAIPLAVALTQAQQNFQKDSQSPSTLREPSMEDYSNFVPQE